MVESVQGSDFSQDVTLKFNRFAVRLCLRLSLRKVNTASKLPALVSAAEQERSI